MSVVNNFFGVIVAELFDRSINILSAADRTGVGCETISRAGRLGDNILVRVVAGVNLGAAVTGSGMCRLCDGVIAPVVTESVTVCKDCFLVGIL